MEVKPEVSIDAAYLVKELGFQVSISLPESSTVDESSENSSDTMPEKDNLTIVLDRSYSMHGSKMEAAKKALLDLFLKRGLLSTFQVVRLIVFDHSAEHIVLSGKSEDDLIILIHSITVSGGTNFAATFQCLREIYTAYIESNNVKNASLNHKFFLPPERIIFLSDGEDNEITTNKTREKHISGLATFLSSLPFQTHINCIGLGARHDAQLLTALSSAGNVPGTFFYSNDYTSVCQAFETTYQTVTDSSAFGATINFYDDNLEKCTAPISLNFAKLEETADDRHHSQCSNTSCERMDTGNKKYTSSWYFTESAKNISVYQLNLPDGTTVRQSLNIVDPICVLDNTKSVKINSSMSDHLTQVMKTYVKTEISKSMRQLPLQTSATFGKKLEEKYRSIHSYINQYIVPIAVLSGSKLSKSIVMEMNSSVSNFFTNILSPFLRGTAINNEMYADLAHSTFSVGDNQVKKLLGKRAMKNASSIDHIEQHVQKVVSIIDFNTFDEETLANEYGTCIFSTMNVIDAMKDGDCMCIGLQISRPQAAIADPSRIQIRNISTSMITANTFLSAASMRLSGTSLASGNWCEGNDKVSEQEGVHGGFSNKMQGVVITGTSREDINGALPLFINESHWRIARLRAKPLFGWMATLDVLGYSQEQMNTIPFLVLHKVLQNIKECMESDIHSEYWARVKLWVTQTCLQILKSHKSLQQSLFVDSSIGGKKELQYLFSAESRLPQHVTSHVVFFRQLYIAGKGGLFNMGNQEKRKLLWYAVTEEYRRIYSRENKQQDAKIQELASIVGCNEDKHVSPIIEKLRNGGIVFSTPDEARRMTKNISIPSWKIQYQATCKSNNMNFTRIYSIYEQFSDILSGIQSEGETIGEDTEGISDVQMLGIMTFCVKYAKSSEVREHLVNYEADFEKALFRSTAWLKNVFSYVVKSLVQRAVDRIMTNQKEAINMNIANLFARSETPKQVHEETNGMLYIGRNVSKCVSELQAIGPTVDLKKVFWKMKYLMYGGSAMGGKSIYTDKDEEKRRKTFNGLSWKPNRRRVRRLMLQHVIKKDSWFKDTRTEERKRVRNEWVSVFPWLQRYISIWCGVSHRDLINDQEKTSTNDEMEL